MHEEHLVMANNHKTPVVRIRWRNLIPPTLKGGGWEVSTDNGVTWTPANRKEVGKLTSTELVLWN